MLLKTKHKIWVARALSAILRAGIGLTDDTSAVVARRRSILWRLDLSQGIDLAIYLNVFERAVWTAVKTLVRPGMRVVDVGANIGAWTLPLASLVGPTGQVLACEPTAYAFHKLKQNLSLNPDLAERVDARQLMVTPVSSSAIPEALHSSWPLGRGQRGHPALGAELKSTRGSAALSLDDLISSCGWSRVDMIKIDVDGFECQVLRGAPLTLSRYRPLIIFELAPYVLAEHGEDSRTLIGILQLSGYQLCSLGGEPFPEDAAALLASIPRGASVNMLAVPAGKNDLLAARSIMCTLRTNDD